MSQQLVVSKIVPCIRCNGGQRKFTQDKVLHVQLRGPEGKPRGVVTNRVTLPATCPACGGCGTVTTTTL